MIQLHHATPAYNEWSIGEQGLKVCYAQGERRIWLHRVAKRKWAKEHVAKRHGCPVQGILVYTVVVPDSWVKRFSDGVYYCDRDIPPCQLTAVTALPSDYRGQRH